jgi:hypothetical protein
VCGEECSHTLQAVLPYDALCDICCKVCAGGLKGSERLAAGMHVNSDIISLL